MYRYCIISIKIKNGLVFIDSIQEDIEDIKQAEKFREAYLTIYPNLEPQNLQVISYKV